MIVHLLLWLFDGDNWQLTQFFQFFCSWSTNFLNPFLIKNRRNSFSSQCRRYWRMQGWRQLQSIGKLLQYRRIISLLLSWWVCWKWFYLYRKGILFDVRILDHRNCHHPTSRQKKIWQNFSPESTPESLKDYLQCRSQNCGNLSGMLLRLLFFWKVYCFHSNFIGRNWLF